MNPSVVYASSWLSVGPPMIGCCQRWSATSIEANPAASAAAQMVASVEPRLAGPPDQDVAGTWRPIFIGDAGRARSRGPSPDPSGHHPLTTTTIVPIKQPVVNR